MPCSTVYGILTYIESLTVNVIMIKCRNARLTHSCTWKVVSVPHNLKNVTESFLTDVQMFHHSIYQLQNSYSQSMWYLVAIAQMRLNLS